MTDADPPASMRAGETALPFDPAAQADATLAFIGRIRTRFGPGDCPKNLVQARASGAGLAVIEVDVPYRPALAGLHAAAPIIVLYWMAGASRRLVRQWPRHRDGPAGTFALRSPARPNPLALAVVRIVSVDAGAGVVSVDALDCWDRTPLIDIKPWFDSVDIPPPNEIAPRNNAV